MLLFRLRAFFGEEISELDELKDKLKRKTDRKIILSTTSAIKFFNSFLLKTAPFIRIHEMEIVSRVFIVFYQRFARIRLLILNFMGKGEGKEHARRGILVGDIWTEPEDQTKRERRRRRERKKERRALTSLMCRGVEDRVFSYPEGSRLVTQILRGWTIELCIRLPTNSFHDILANIFLSSVSTSLHPICISLLLRNEREI